MYASAMNAATTSIRRGIRRFYPHALTIFSSLSLAACATPQLNYIPESQQFSRPPINSTSTASVGDEMVSQGKLSTQEGIIINHQVHISWAYTLGPGFYPKIGDDRATNYYSFRTGDSSSQNYGVLTKNPIADPPEAIHAKKNGSNICIVTIFHVQVCNHNAQAQLTTRSLSTENSFQQTLIYNGRVGNKIDIGYREFSGSMARPAFNNNVEYDLSTSDIISYRGAKLKIIKADNSSITYITLSNFNTSD